MSRMSKKVSAGLVGLLLGGGALVTAGPALAGAGTIAAALAGMGALATIMGGATVITGGGIGVVTAMWATPQPTIAGAIWSALSRSTARSSSRRSAPDKHPAQAKNTGRHHAA